MVTADLDALPVLDVVSIEWPDEDTPCNWPSCDAGAAWWFECVCGVPAYACEPHRQANDRTIADSPAARYFGYVKCKRCAAHLSVPIPWRPLR